MSVDVPPIRSSVDGQRAWSGLTPAESWSRSEQFLALAGTALIAARIQLTPQLLTMGDLLAVACAPLWFPTLRRYVGARLWLFIGVLCIPAGLMLSWLHAVDHQLRLGTSIVMTVMLLSLLSGVGFLVWAKERVSLGALVSAYGAGMLVGVSHTTALFATNPWKFGFALPVSILALGLARLSGRRGAELGVAVVLCVVSAWTDARSSFALFLVTAALLAWQMRPRTSTRKGSAARAIIGFAIMILAVYNLGQALILEGLLGAETQARSRQQIATAGSLILGGRPEIAATLNLMRVEPFGFGSATIPNYNDIKAAKTGMKFIGYDPDNGYVERWMFGNGYALHSGFGDLWAIYGPIGLLFAGFMLALVLRRLGETLVNRTASGVLIFAGSLTVWNIFFAPLYSGLRMLILVLALSLVLRPQPPADPLAGPRSRRWSG